MSKTWTHASSAERFERLPKWAQREIENLQRKVRDAEAYAAELRHEMNDPETKVFIGNYTEGDIPLPARTRIVFKLDGAEIEVAPSEHHESITVRSNGGGVLSFWPEVSNSVRVEARR